MDSSKQQWLVEDFRLDHPASEFEDYAQSEIARFRTADPTFDDSLHREAVEVILKQLNRPGQGGKQ